MPPITAGTSAPESDTMACDSWFRRALARCQAEESGEGDARGAEFNSFI